MTEMRPAQDLWKDLLRTLTLTAPCPELSPDTFATISSNWNTVSSLLEGTLVKVPLFFL